MASPETNKNKEQIHIKAYGKLTFNGKLNLELTHEKPPEIIKDIKELSAYYLNGENNELIKSKKNNFTTDLENQVKSVVFKLSEDKLEFLENKTIYGEVEIVCDGELTGEEVPIKSFKVSENEKLNMKFTVLHIVDSSKQSGGGKKPKTSSKTNIKKKLPNTPNTPQNINLYNILFPS